MRYAFRVALYILCKIIHTHLCKSVKKNSCCIIKFLRAHRTCVSRPSSIFSCLPKAPWDCERTSLLRLCRELPARQSQPPPNSSACTRIPGWGTGNTGMSLALFCPSDEIIKSPNPQNGIGTRAMSGYKDRKRTCVGSKQKETVAAGKCLSPQ